MGAGAPDTPRDVWLYNVAGLSHASGGRHEEAVEWLAEGVRLGLELGDPEELVGQMSAQRRASLRALGRGLDELERRAGAFLAEQRERQRPQRQAEALDEERLAAPSRAATVSLTWFPAGEYERARERWPDLREEWDGVPHADYCAALQRHLLRFKREGLPVRAVAPIALDDYVPFCQQRELDPQDPASRAGYATELTALGRTIPWPPSRNAPCWCGSHNKYKRCCCAVAAGPPHPG